MAKKQIILIVFILINIISITFAQPISSSSHEASELNLTVNCDKNEIYLNQYIKIYFNFTNEERDRKAYANNVTFIASISKSLARPNEKIRIENKGDKESNKTSGESKIYSDFNKHNIGRGDWAEIRPDGTIYIYFSKLDPGEGIEVAYITKYVSNFSCDPEVLFSTVWFTWDIHKDNIKRPISPTFKGLNHKPCIDAFEVNVEPGYNITCWNTPNCTIFEGSKIFFANNTHDQDDENYNRTCVDVNYFDDKIEPDSPPIRIESGDRINDSGIHQFQIKASDSIESNSTNSTYFKVINLVSYHKSLITDVFDLYKYETLIPTWLLLIIIYISLIKSNLIRDKTKLGRYLMSISILIVVGLGLYYDHPESYYKSLLLLESGGLIISFFVYILYILCVKESCTLLSAYEFSKTTIAMVSTVLIFHFFLPDILSQKVTYAVLLSALLFFLTLILKVQDKIKAVFRHTDSIESKNSINMATIMVVEIALLSILIYYTTTIITFKPRFALFDLVIIGIMEVSLVNIVVAAIMHKEILIEIFESEVPFIKILLQKFP